MMPQKELENFKEVPIQIEAELDKKQMTLEALLALDVGSVIKTDRSVGENLDIFAGGTMICSGEVVIIEEKVGIRITDFREEA